MPVSRSKRGKNRDMDMDIMDMDMLHSKQIEWNVDGSFENKNLIDTKNALEKEVAGQMMDRTYNRQATRNKIKKDISEPSAKHLKNLCKNSFFKDPQLKTKFCKISPNAITMATETMLQDIEEGARRRIENKSRSGKSKKSSRIR